jgi:hypothetical protein
MYAEANPDLIVEAAQTFRLRPGASAPKLSKQRKAIAVVFAHHENQRSQNS